jgi:hypothetical protein
MVTQRQKSEEGFLKATLTMAKIKSLATKCKTFATHVKHFRLGGLD